MLELYEVKVSRTVLRRGKASNRFFLFDIIIGFIAQLFISLMRYEFKELKHKSTKFIKKNLLNLTVTLDSWQRTIASLNCCKL